MILATIDSPGPALSEADLESLEAKLGVVLPVAYRQFLMTHNGGRPEPDGVDVPGYDETDVQVLFGLGRTIESSCIEWNLDTLANRLPSGLVPVATDSGGNVFLLSLRGADHGAVLYGDLDAVFGDLDAELPIFMVSPTFDDFLASLIE